VQRVGRHRELGERIHQALGHRLPHLMAEHLPDPEIFEKVARLLADDRHARGL
jgi:hypothetical protein